jgi:hypothetical protein
MIAMAEVEVDTEVDSELLKELIETGKKIQKELDEFNEKLDILIEVVTDGEIINWID